MSDKKYSPANKYKDYSRFQHLKKLMYLTYLMMKMLSTELIIWLHSSLFQKSPEALRNKLALVTGGGNGLGRAFCFRLAKEGCDIAVLDIDYESAVKTACDISMQFGVKSQAFQCDISNYSAICDLKTSVENKMKKVDILVNNAGLLYMSNFIESDVKDIQRVVDVNLTSHFLVSHRTQVAIKHN